MIFTLSLVVIAFFAGALGATLGVGGGIIVVPGLTLLLGLPIHEAIGSSITAVIATSSASTLSYITRGYVNVRLGLLLEIPTVIGAVLGGLLAVSLHGNILQIIFAGLLVYSAIAMARPTTTAGTTALGQDNPGWLAASFREPTSGGEVYYTPRRMKVGMPACMLAGLVSGLLGVGGGIVKIPLLTTLMMVPMRAAMATSSFMIGLTGAASAFIYYSHGYATPSIAGPTAIGILIGARVGTKVFRKLHPRSLTLMFVALLVISAIRMVSEVIK